MSFNINTFRGSFIDTGEPLSPSHFEVTINLPAMGLDGMSSLSSTNLKDIAQRVSLRCESVTLPARNLNTIDRITAGPTRKVAVGSTYDTVDMTFILSGNTEERSLFSTWQNFIVDPSNGSSINYYDNYTGSVDIVTFDKSGNETLKVRMIEAYPVSVGDIQMSWNESNTYATITVSMAFRYWIDALSEGSTNQSEIFGQALGAASLVSSLTGLNPSSSVSTILGVGATAAGALGGEKVTVSDLSGDSPKLPEQVTSGSGSQADSLFDRASSLINDALT